MEPIAAAQRDIKEADILAVYQVLVVYIEYRNLSLQFKNNINALNVVMEPGDVCQYNEDCPPHKLCDRLNRRCINPCLADSCGENADCIPKDHESDCQCKPGYIGNPYIICNRGKYHN